jgi:histidinol phosphatase-like PHP family hydrolase
MIRFVPRPRFLRFPWRSSSTVSIPEQPPLRDGLHTDWHAHSRWSDGQARVGTMVEQAERLGITLGVSDHGLRDNARLQTADQLATYVDDLAQHPVLRGLEISIGDLWEHSGPALDRPASAGRLELTATEDGPPLPEGGGRSDLLDRFNYVIASLHGIRVPEGIIHSTRYLNWRAGLYPLYRPSVRRYDRRRYFATVLRELQETAACWPVTILGHFCLMPELVNKQGTYSLDEDQTPDQEALDWLDAIIQTCIERDIAIELNSKSRAPHEGFVQRALELGARFSLGSDAHQRHRVGDLFYGRSLAERLEIPVDRFLRPQDVLARPAPPHPDTRHGTPAA